MNLNIITLSKQISKQKVISLGLFNDAKLKRTSKYFKLYNAIIENEIETEEEIYSFLEFKTIAACKKFKLRYTKKLLDYLLISDNINNKVDYRTELYIELCKLLSAARILHFRQAKNNAVKLYLHIIKESQKYGFTDLKYFALVRIKKHFAFIEPNKKLYKTSYLHLKQTMHEINKEYDLDDFYDSLSHENVISDKINSPQYKIDALQKTNKLLNGVEPEDTFAYKNRVYEIATFVYKLNDLFEESLAISEEAIELCNNDHVSKSNMLVTTYKDIISTYLKMKDYENASIYLEKILSIKRTVGHNYFRIKGLEFALKANQQDFTKLYVLTKEINSLKKLKQSRVHNEEWTIRDAYVNIFVELGKIDEETLTLYGHKKFRLNKFINDVEFYAKDKRGVNISIHVVQLIHFLIRKEYHKISDKLDSLTQYTHRYLKNDETFRSNCFIKMLLRLPEAEYNPIRTKRYVAKYEKKLRSKPYEISLKELNVEIIPYEYLWETILEILDNNLKRKKKNSQTIK